jgi:hypothetical protein
MRKIFVNFPVPLTRTFQLLFPAISNSSTNTAQRYLLEDSTLRHVPSSHIIIRTLTFSGFSYSSRKFFSHIRGIFWTVLDVVTCRGHIVVVVISATEYQLTTSRETVDSRTDCNSNTKNKGVFRLQVWGREK